jgi:hypothetical protein
MTGSTGNLSFVDVLRPYTADLGRYGVTQVIEVEDVFNTHRGLSLYLVVQSDRWGLIVDAQPFHYPHWLISLYGSVHTIAAEQMDLHGFRWIRNEALGRALPVFQDAQRQRANVQRTLRAYYDAMVAAVRAGGLYISAPESPLRDVLSEINERITAEGRSMNAEEVARFNQAADHDGGAVYEIMYELYPWFESEPHDQWAQLTVLPSGSPNELTRRILRRAVTMTRYGWNFVPGADVATDMTEITAHLRTQRAILHVEP